jgi:hypothetical protein
MYIKFQVLTEHFFLPGYGYSNTILLLRSVRRSLSAVPMIKNERQNYTIEHAGRSTSSPNSYYFPRPRAGVGTILVANHPPNRDTRASDETRFRIAPGRKAQK